MSRSPCAPQACQRALQSLAERGCVDRRSLPAIDRSEDRLCIRRTEIADRLLDRRHQIAPDRFVLGGRSVARSIDRPMIFAPARDLLPRGPAVPGGDAEDPTERV